MKTLIFSAMVLAFTFIGCAKDDDIVRPVQLISHSKTIIPDQQNSDWTSVANNYCKDLKTEHILLGKGVWADEYEQVDDKYNSQYILAAEGQASLNETELGRSQLKLEYNPATQTFAGELFTYFEQITMVHKFFGTVTETFDDAAAKSKDPVINGVAELVRGSVETSLGEFLLRDEASLRIAVNPTPEGDVDVKVAINGMYCVTENIFISRF